MKRSLLLLTAAALAGCSTLPGDGPSQRAIVRGGDIAEAASDYALVDLSFAVSEVIKAMPPRFGGSLALASAEAPVDVIGVGDTVAISIYEPGGSLFGVGGATAGVQSSNQMLPPLVVDRSGGISVPFAGTVRVEGLTAPEAADAVQRALRGKAANPQVVASVAQNASNAVTVLGEVRNPGRAPLSANNDRILDVIAVAGGASKPVEDIIVNIRRDSETFSAPLALVTSEFGENVRLRRGDQINLAYKPRRFTTFGAVTAVNEVDMGPGDVTLTAALARANGLDTRSANHSSVMVFRFERPEVAQALGIAQAPTPRGVPVVYRLNLREGQGFFIANSFLVESGDVIYAPRSDSAELRKFFEFVQTLTRVVYDISVTSALNID